MYRAVIDPWRVAAHRACQSALLAITNTTQWIQHPNWYVYNRKGQLIVVPVLKTPNHVDLNMAAHHVNTVITHPVCGL